MSQTRRGTHLYIIIVLYASETPRPSLTFEQAFQYNDA